jgi:hypothetical protein
MIERRCIPGRSKFYDDTAISKKISSCYDWLTKDPKHYVVGRYLWPSDRAFLGRVENTSQEAGDQDVHLELKNSKVFKVQSCAP